jgi:predicted TPR repeat methyltransferase
MMQNSNAHRSTIEDVKNRFEGLASSYEKTLEKHRYFGADQIVKTFTRHGDNGTKKNCFDILDLGCGTGLCGQKFTAFAKSLDGVDLSPKMLEIAHKRGIYDHLYSGSVETYFTQTSNTYDVIVAASLFLYFNDLQPVFNSCFSHLRPGGFFVFTADRHDGDVADVLPSPRGTLMFTHGQAYVERCLQSAGFSLISLDKIDERLNWQNNTPVPAFVVLAMRPA